MRKRKKINNPQYVNIFFNKDDHKSCSSFFHHQSVNFGVTPPVAKRSIFPHPVQPMIDEKESTKKKKVKK